MEFSIRVFLVVTMCLLLKADVSAKHAPRRPNLKVKDEQYLRMMLLTQMEQNRRLVNRNKQLQQVWLDMKDMCEVLTISSCECDTTQVNSSDLVAPYTYTNTIRRSSMPEETEIPVQIISVNSSGMVGNFTTVSVIYRATPKHTTEWVCLRENGGVWRTAGRREKTLATRSLFTSTVTIEGLDKMKEIFFFLYNEEESVNIRFNLTEIQTYKEQHMLVPSAKFLTVNTSYIAPANGNFEILAVIDRKVSSFTESDSFEVFFTGVNGSSSKIFEIFSFNSDVITVHWSDRTNLTSTLGITIQSPYVQYGGILTMRFWQPMTGMLNDLYYGPLIKILSSDVEHVVHNNTLGVFPLASETVIYPPTSSLMCAAMGNPRPTVSVLKIAEGHKTVELLAENVVLDEHMNMKILTLAWNQTQSVEGHYICRASNGNQTIDSHSEVIVFDPVVFNETDTGVMRNDSKIIVLSCAANGKPKPEVSLRLYGDYGPSLANAGIYKVRNTDKFSSRVTLAILTEDGPDLHTVYCVASQSGGNRINKRIELFPGEEKRYNWEVYERHEKSTGLIQ